LIEQVDYSSLASAMSVPMDSFLGFDFWYDRAACMSWPDAPPDPLSFIFMVTLGHVCTPKCLLCFIPVYTVFRWQHIIF
jgi:hypothetical protein